MITLALSLFVNVATVDDVYDNTVFTSFKTLQECELYIQTHESEWIQTENLIKYSARCSVN